MSEQRYARLKWLCANSKPGEVDSTVELGMHARQFVPELFDRIAALERERDELLAGLKRRADVEPYWHIGVRSDGAITSYTVVEGTILKADYDALVKALDEAHAAIREAAELISKTGSMKTRDVWWHETHAPAIRRASGEGK